MGRQSYFRVTVPLFITTLIQCSASTCAYWCPFSWWRPRPTPSSPRPRNGTVGRSRGTPWGPPTVSQRDPTIPGFWQLLPKIYQEFQSPLSSLTSMVLRKPKDLPMEIYRQSRNRLYYRDAHDKSNLINCTALLGITQASVWIQPLNYLRSFHPVRGRGSEGTKESEHQESSRTWRNYWPRSEVLRRYSLLVCLLPSLMSPLLPLWFPLHLKNLS